MTDDRRANRIADEIREFLSIEFSLRLTDPRLSGVVVSSVRLSPDLSLATISLRLLIGDEDERKRKAAVRGAESAAVRLRRGLAAVLRMKRVPDIRFFYDTGLDNESNVERLLQEISEERANTPEEE